MPPDMNMTPEFVFLLPLHTHSLIIIVKNEAKQRHKLGSAKGDHY